MNNDSVWGQSSVVWVKLGVLKMADMFFMTDELGNVSCWNRWFSKIRCGELSSRKCFCGVRVKYEWFERGVKVTLFRHTGALRVKTVHTIVSPQRTSYQKAACLIKVTQRAHVSPETLHSCESIQRLALSYLSWRIHLQRQETGSQRPEILKTGSFMWTGWDRRK